MTAKEAAVRAQSFAAVAMRTVRGLRHSRASRTVGTTGVILVLGMVASIQIARWLGPQGRGEIAASQLWPILLIYLASMGFIQSILYHGAQAELDPGAIYGTALACGVMQSAVAMVFGYLNMPWLLSSQGPKVVTASQVYLLVIPLSLGTQYAIALIQARLYFATFNALRLVLPLGYFVAIYVLHASVVGVSPMALVIVLLLLHLVMLVAGIVALYRLGIVKRLSVNGALARRLASYGAKAHAGAVSQAANLRLDQALMSALFPPVQLGIYVTAVSTASLLSVLATSLQMLITPIVANRATMEERVAQLVHMFQRYWTLSIVASLALAAAIPFLIPLVFGEQFRPAVTPALILVVAGVMIGAKDVLSGGAQALGDPWLASRSEIIALGVTAVALLLLFPRFGIIGAALAALAAYSTQFLIVLQGLATRHGVAVGSLIRPVGPLGILVRTPAERAP